jgi:hypothetical protein
MCFHMSDINSCPSFSLHSGLWLTRLVFETEAAMPKASISLEALALFDVVRFSNNVYHVCLAMFTCFDDVVLFGQTCLHIV